MISFFVASIDCGRPSHALQTTDSNAYSFFYENVLHIKNTVVKAQRPMFNNNLKFEQF